MTTVTTRAVLERAIALGMANYEAIADELLADDHGREGWKKRQAEFLGAFPDNQWSIDALLADDDRGAIQYTVTGTHTGQIESLAPTGRQVTISGATFFRVAGGKVAETWAFPDRLALLKQLGFHVAG
mgnify:CR=1 FL=1